MTHPPDSVLPNALSSPVDRSTAPATRDPAPDAGPPEDPWCAFDWRASGQTIPERVHALAIRHPDRLAVYDAEVQLGFDALDRAANRVANALLAARGAGPEAVILLLGVGAAAVVAALGVLRAGKHFVGVEPTFPPARIAQIAADATAAVVLTDATHLPLAREVAGTGRAIVDLDALGDADERAPDARVGPDAMALLNYTSGSTGTPKGVVHSHRSAIAHACRYANAFRLGGDDRVASFGSLAWAGPIWDVFGPLCLGAGVGLHDVRRHGMHALPSWLERTRSTVISGMTIARRLAFDFPQTRLPAVRLVQLGGDTVYRRDVEGCRRVFPHAVIAVGLGLTEAGRIAEQHIAHGAALAHEVVPVGFAVPGVRIRLVAEDGNEVAAGEVGEIVVQSDDLAVGYWRLPRLTAERFRCDPRFGSARLYFTGDLGRMLADGSLQHAGRKDFQIKIHGYQVAANEIEALLLGIEGVGEACVVVQRLPSGDEQLVAFLARTAAGMPAAATLRARLLERLPDYMVPRRFVELEALPRTATAKIDRNALPSAALAHCAAGSERAAPRTALEADVAAIWAEVLGVDAVGVDEDFLALGGDSLAAARIANRVVQAFGLVVPLRALLARATVATMAALIAAASATGATPAPATGIPGRGR